MDGAAPGTAAAAARFAPVITETEIVARLLVAAALGCLIGLERERLLWSAGIRTHMLVCVGASLLMIVSAYGFGHATQMPHVVLDPSRIAAQVVSGIGFLGAGSILLRNNTIRGLTTAASIWAVAALGLAAGGGMYFAAIAATVVILVILAGLKPLEEAYRSRVQRAVLYIEAEPGALGTDDLKRVLRLRGGQIQHVHRAPADEGLEKQIVHLVRVSHSDIRVGAKRLATEPGIHSVEVKKSRKPKADA